MSGGVRRSPGRCAFGAASRIDSLEPRERHAAAVPHRGLGDDDRQRQDAAMIEQVVRRVEHAVLGIAEAVEESFGACGRRRQAEKRAEDGRLAYDFSLSEQRFEAIIAPRVEWRCCRMKTSAILVAALAAFALAAQAATLSQQDREDRGARAARRRRGPHRAARWPSSSRRRMGQSFIVENVSGGGGVDRLADRGARGARRLHADARLRGHARDGPGGAQGARTTR